MAQAEPQTETLSLPISESLRHRLEQIRELVSRRKGESASRLRRSPSSCWSRRARSGWRPAGADLSFQVCAYEARQFIRSGPFPASRGFPRSRTSRLTQANRPIADFKIADWRLRSCGHRPVSIPSSFLGCFRRLGLEKQMKMLRHETQPSRRKPNLERAARKASKKS